MEREFILHVLNYIFKQYQAPHFGKKKRKLSSYF